MIVQLLNLVRDNSEMFPAKELAKMKKTSEEKPGDMSCIVMDWPMFQ